MASALSQDSADRNTDRDPSDAQSDADRSEPDTSRAPCGDPAVPARPTSRWSAQQDPETEFSQLSFKQGAVQVHKGRGTVDLAQVCGAKRFGAVPAQFASYLEERVRVPEEELRIDRARAYMRTLRDFLQHLERSEEKVDLQAGAEPLAMQIVSYLEEMQSVERQKNSDAIALARAQRVYQVLSGQFLEFLKREELISFDVDQVREFVAKSGVLQG